MKRDPVQPMHFRKGTSCFSLKWDNDWSGRGGNNRPVNPMHFGEDSSCFSLNWKNDGWSMEYAVCRSNIGGYKLYPGIDFADISCL